MPDPVTNSCQSCGFANEEYVIACRLCNAPLVGAAAVDAAFAERKQVSVLFSDMSGFTALSERLDPEDMRAIMASVFASAAKIVASYDGRIEKFIGDAIMAIFGVPTAHEDDPVRAVRAALELHAAVAALSPQVQARTGTPIALHSGINTGLVVTGELRFGHGTAGPLGDTINLAARLMNAAPTGEIWVGPETRRMVEQAFDLDDLGPRDFKGKAGSVTVARVRGAQARILPVRQFRSSFVGRQAEFGALLGAAERLRDGQASVFGICGDAGTGKSRLVAEFRERIGHDVQWLEGRAYPYAQNIPYAPIIDLLSRAWAIEETDPPVAVREKIEAAIEGLVPEPKTVLPLLLHLYNLPQEAGTVIEREAFQQRLLDAMRRMLAILAARAPTVVCLQDMHWADASSVILLRGLSETLRMPVLILGNYRPGFAPLPGMTVLELTDLSARQTAEMLASLLKGPPPAELTRVIAERSDGNPFYVEEVVNALVETAVLRQDAAGWALARPLSETAIPATVTGVIAARIDRLAEPRRLVLRHAAVVGRAFLHDVLAQVTSEPTALAPSLDELQQADLIRQRRPAPELEYIFKHALTQEVAYDGLLKSERRELHARIAMAMERVFVSRIGEFVETLAYHYFRGGVTDKAVHYLIEAGRKCVARYALREAASHYAEAYALIGAGERSPEQRRMLVDLLVSWSQVQYYDGTIGEWRRLLEKHLADADGCAEPALLAMYLAWLGLVRGFNGDIRGSHEALERAVQTAQAAGARDALAYALAWQTFTLFEIGRPAESLNLGHLLHPTDEEFRRNPYPYAFGRCGLVIAQVVSGDLKRAREIAQDVIASGRAGGNARAESLGHFVLAYCQVVALEFDGAAATAQAGMLAAKDPFFESTNANVRTVALAVGMHLDDARRLCNAWLPTFVQLGNVWFARTLSSVGFSMDLASGQLSDGLRGMQAVLADLKNAGYLVAAALCEVFLLMTYVSIARRDVKPEIGAILRNPWFVFTQAPFATRNARRMIKRLRLELPQNSMHGFLGIVDLCEGRLLAHRGEQVQAQMVIQRIRTWLDEAGVEEVPKAVKELQAQVDSLKR